MTPAQIIMNHLMPWLADCWKVEFRFSCVDTTPAGFKGNPPRFSLFRVAWWRLHLVFANPTSRYFIHTGILRELLHAHYSVPGP